jgi:hypothetical protein
MNGLASDADRDGEQNVRRLVHASVLQMHLNSGVGAARSFRRRWADHKNVCVQLTEHN